MEGRTFYNTQHNDDEAISYYVEMKKRLDVENDNFNYVMDHMPPVYSHTDAYIKDYIKDLTKEDLHSRAIALIKTQNLDKHNELIDHMGGKSYGNFSHFRNQWSPLIWQTHEDQSNQKIKIGDKIVNSSDLDFSIAQSLEVIDAGENPTTEYFKWVTAQEKIESDINTDGTTPSEIDLRKMFIGLMDKRETEIKRVAALYSAAAFNPNSPYQKIAQERLQFTLFKLSELRRLRDRMNATKSHPDNFKDLPAHVQSEERIRQNITKYKTNENLTELENQTPTETLFDNMFMPNSLNDHLVDGFTRTRQNTSAQYEPQEIIARYKTNQETMLDMLKAMRNGSSKEEWKKTQSSPQQTIQPRTIRGFDLAAYKQALRDLDNY